jgi:hypothetical protein
LPIRKSYPLPVVVLPRMCLGIMRGGQGISVPIRAIAVRALARKVSRSPRRRIFKMTRVRLQQLFLRLDQRGITTKVGRGNVEPADYLPPGGYPPAALPPSKADYCLPPLAPQPTMVRQR